VTITAVATAGSFADLREGLLGAVAALGAVVLLSELCGFFSKERGRPVLRARRKRSYTVAHIVRCAEAAFVVSSFWIPIHPDLWLCLIDAAIFMHFRRSHKRVAHRLGIAPRVYGLPKRRKARPANDGTIYIGGQITSIRRVGVGVVVLAATIIPPLGSLGAAGAAIGHSLRAGTESKGRKEEHNTKRGGATGTTPESPSKKPSEETTPDDEPTAPRSPARSDWNRKCAQEGKGAPAWSEPNIVNLYEGLGSAGPAFLGCTGKMHRYRSQRCGEFVWALGENPAVHEILSLVTACEKPAFATVYSVPASGFVRELIENEGDHTVYGPHKITTGEGDMYLVETESGTYALVRYATGGASVQNYIELPPPVVQAWIGDMHEAHTWLWPTAVETAGAAREYVFAENGDIENELPPYTATYQEEDNAQGEEEYVATRGPWKYRFSEKKTASTSELEQVAEQAKS